VKITIMVTSDYATIDPITGKLHILGVFRAIYASTFPCQHKRMCLALTIEGEIADSENPHELFVTLTDEDGTHVFSLKGAFELPQGMGGNRPQCNLLVEFNDLRFERPGEYCFYLTINGDELDEYTAIQVLQREVSSV